MSGGRRASLAGVIVRLALFTALSIVLSAVVVASLLNLNTTASHSYHAIFRDASDLQSGDPVRVAGVQVGRVQSVAVYGVDLAKVTFKLDTAQVLTGSSRAQIDFENLFGQHNLTLLSGGPAPRLAPGAVIPVSRTLPALDLSDLFNGFQPLFQALTPSDINQLTANIIGTFQGQAGSLASLVNQAGKLTNNLADRKTVIDQVVDNLTSLLHVVGDHDNQLAALIDNFDTLTGQISGERGQISSAIGSANGLVNSLGHLTGALQAPLQSAVTSLNSVTGALAANQGRFGAALNVLPPTFSHAAKVVQNGAFVNVYYCSLAITIPTPVPILPAPFQQGLSGLLKDLGISYFPYLSGVVAPSGQLGDPNAHSPNCEP